MQRLTFLSLIGLCFASPSAHANLYSEGFDSSAADVKVNKSADSAVEYVDYSNFTVGATNFVIPEAPNRVAGSVATSGVLMRVNHMGSPGGTGAAAAINMLAGATPINFSGDYTVSYDVYMNTSDPSGIGSTHQALFGLGTNDDGVLEASFNRGAGTIGTWGWLNNENGSGTEDAAINQNGVELADIGDSDSQDVSAGISPGLFNQAFVRTNVPTTNASAARQWVHVELRNVQGHMLALFNGVKFFGNNKDPNISSTATVGYAMLGFEDRFASISTQPDLSWALFDNFVVTEIPLPAFNIFQWEFVDPQDPSQGKRQSSTITTGGYGLAPQPGLAVLYKDLTMAYLHGADLRNADFTSTILSNADLTQANLTHAKLEGTRLAGADFSGAQIRGANFSNSISEAITFAQLASTASYQERDLSRINLSRTSLLSANFSNINLTEAKFLGAAFRNTSFRQATLVGANFEGADLTGADLTGADVRRASFQRNTFYDHNYGSNDYSTSTGISVGQLSSTASYAAHDLSDMDFTGNDLAGADFTGQNLTNSIFYSARLTGTTFTDAVVKGALFLGSGTGTLTAEQLYSTASYRQRDLVGVQIYADLGDVDLSGQDLTAAKLKGTFDDADFRQANLTSAFLGDSFKGANFMLAKFAGATLSHADLTGANLDQANFAGAILDDSNFSNTNITLEQLYSTASYQSRDLLGIGLAGNNLAGANFVGKLLGSAKFMGANLAGANFTDANANVAQLMNADLTGANLTNANFTGANFSGANLAGANIHGSRIGGQLIYEERCQGRPAAGGCIGAIIQVPVGSYGGINLPLLTTTASYLERDLSSTGLSNIFLAGADFAGFNLTGANFFGTVLTGANLSGADARGVHFEDAILVGANLSAANLTNANFSFVSYGTPPYDYKSPGANLSNANLSAADARGANFQSAKLTDANTTNLIQPNGHIAGLSLNAGASLVVRDYDGNTAASPTTGPLPIVVDQHLAMDATGALRMILEADAWDSTISFAAGIPVTMGGTLELVFADGTNLASQVGRTFDLFDWTGVSPTGAFVVGSPYSWNLSKLYTTGEVTLTAVPEPSALLLLGYGMSSFFAARRLPRTQRGGEMND